MEGEPPEVSDGGKVVRARKNWRCCDCGILIPKKTTYWALSGKWDGDWQTIRMCLTCLEFRNSVPGASMTEIAFGRLYEFVSGYLEVSHLQTSRWLARVEAIDFRKKILRRG